MGLYERLWGEGGGRGVGWGACSGLKTVRFIILLQMTGKFRSEGLTVGPTETLGAIIAG